MNFLALTRLLLLSYVFLFSCAVSGIVEVTTGSISFGQQIAGSIESGGSDYYAVTITEFTSRIFFETCGSAYHTKLEFFDSEENSLAYCDDCNDGGVACGLQGDLTVERLAPGQYFLKIAGFRSNEYGDYVISMSSGFMDCGDVTAVSLSADEIQYFETQSSSSGAYSLAVLETCEETDIWTGADSAISLALYDTDGASLVSGSSLSNLDRCTSGNVTSDIDVTSYINTGTKYFLAITSETGGDYSLELACEAVDTEVTTTTTTQTPLMTQTANTIHFGETVSGSIEQNGQKYFAFDLVGDTARVFLESCDSEFDVFMRVYDATGSTEVAYCEDCDTGGDDCGLQGDLTIDGLSAGRYYLVISGYEGEFGAFAISMSNGYLDCEVTTLVTGNSDTRQTQYYEYRLLTAGMYSVVNLEACSTDGEVTLAVYNAQAEEETEYGDKAETLSGTCGTGSVVGNLDVTSYANGVNTVFFSISGFAEQSTAFELKLLCEDATTTTTTTVSPVEMNAVGAISFGQEVTGILAPGGENIYTIDLEAEETPRVFFESCGSSFDTFLRLYDSSGKQKSYCDNCNNGGDECGLAGDLTVENLEAGRYYLGISSLDDTQSGSYVISMSNGYITCGDTLDGLVGAGEKAYFEYYASAGTSNYKLAYLESCGSQYDTELYVFDNSGDQVAYGDDLNNFGADCITGSLSGDLEVTSYANSASKYFFAIGGASTDESSYTMQLVCEEDTTTTTTSTVSPDGPTSATESISYANEVSGTISADGEDYYVVDLAYSTAVLFFEACGSDYQTYLKLYNAAGSEIASCYDCNTGSDTCALQGDLTVNNLAAGRYYLGVAGYGSSAGSYYVTMSNGYVSCDQTVTGYMVGSLKSYYQFLPSATDAGNAGVDSYLKLCGTVSGSNLYVYDLSGSVLVSGDDELDVGTCATGSLVASLEVMTYVNSNDKSFFGTADFDDESGTYSMQLVCSEETAASVSVHDLIHHDWLSELGLISVPGESLMYSDEMVSALAVVVVFLMLLNCYHIKPCQSNYNRSRVAFEKVVNTDMDRTDEDDIDSDEPAVVN